MAEGNRQVPHRYVKGADGAWKLDAGFKLQPFEYGGRKWINAGEQPVVAVLRVERDLPHPRPGQQSAGGQPLHELLEDVVAHHIGKDAHVPEKLPAVEQDRVRERIGTGQEDRSGDADRHPEQSRDAEKRASGSRLAPEPHPGEGEDRRHDDVDELDRPALELPVVLCRAARDDCRRRDARDHQERCRPEHLHRGVARRSRWPVPPAHRLLEDGLRGGERGEHEQRQIQAQQPLLQHRQREKQPEECSPQPAQPRPIVGDLEKREDRETRRDDEEHLGGEVVDAEVNRGERDEHRPHHHTARDAKTTPGPGRAAQNEEQRRERKR